MSDFRELRNRLEQLYIAVDKADDQGLCTHALREEINAVRAEIFLMDGKSKLINLVMFSPSHERDEIIEMIKTGRVTPTAFGTILQVIVGEQVEFDQGVQKAVSSLTLAA